MATEAKTPGAQGHGWNVSDTAVLCCSVWCWICIQIECELISVSMVCRISVNTFCIEPNEMQQKHWEINSWIKLAIFSFLLWKRKQKRFTHRTRLINLNKISQMHGICFVWSTRCDANQTKPNRINTIYCKCIVRPIWFTLRLALNSLVALKGHSFIININARKLAEANDLKARKKNHYRQCEKSAFPVL